MVVVRGQQADTLIVDRQKISPIFPSEKTTPFRHHPARKGFYGFVVL